MTEVQRMQRRLIILQSASDILRDRMCKTRTLLDDAVKEAERDRIAQEDADFEELKRQTKPATEIAEDLANQIVNLTMGIQPKENDDA